MTGRALAVAAAILALAAPAAAHELVHEIVRGRAVALRASFSDGEPLAYVEYQVFAPADPNRPWQKGRTDRAGWLAFVPSEPGGWRVKVVDPSGHGLDVSIPVEPGASTAPSAPASGALRGIAGAAAIAALFAALFLLQRRRARRA